VDDPFILVVTEGRANEYPVKKEENAVVSFDFRVHPRNGILIGETFRLDWNGRLICGEDNTFLNLPSLDLSCGFSEIYLLE